MVSSTPPRFVLVRVPSSTPVQTRFLGRHALSSTDIVCRECLELVDDVYVNFELYETFKWGRLALDPGVHIFIFYLIAD